MGYVCPNFRAAPDHPVRAALALYNGGAGNSEESRLTISPPAGGSRKVLMEKLSRIGVSLDSELLNRFDQFIAEKGYENRSEAFRDLIRDRLVTSAVIAPNARVVGTVTLIYDHHTRLLPEKLTDLQHAHHAVVISTLHAHLDGDRCLEVVLLRGKSKDVRQLGDLLISTKGVQHGRLVMSSPETASRASAHPHSHHH